jgi:lysyl-tRNA synthetase class 2
LTLQEAVLQFANIDMLSTIATDGTTNRDEFARLSILSGVNVDDDDNWSDIFTKILVAKIEPHLGVTAPTILCEYPLPEGALAQKCRHDPRVVERFELYICGVEIANGFGELIDSVEQRARFEDAMHKQEKIYGKAYPIDEDLLEAIKYMPPTSGVALGFERLVMLISGARRINDVCWIEFNPD